MNRQCENESENGPEDHGGIERGEAEELHGHILNPAGTGCFKPQSPRIGTISAWERFWRSTRSVSPGAHSQAMHALPQQQLHTGSSAPVTGSRMMPSVRWQTLDLASDSVSIPAPPRHRR
jgi:hypothetical protein